MANVTADTMIWNNIYITVESVIGAIAVVGNSLVICAVKLNPDLQDATFYFVVSLALADLAVGFLILPLAIILSMEIQLHFQACLFICCLIIILTNASILSLLAIAIDRYWRIKIPTRYRAVITKKRIYLCIYFSWTMAVVGALVPMFGWNNKSNLEEQDRSYLNCRFLSVMSLNYLVYFCFFGWVLIPLLIMVVLYTQIFYLIRKQLRQNASKSQGRGTLYSKEYKTAASLALVMFLFALCWLPISIVNCIIYFYPSVVEFKEILPAVLLTIVLSHLNSAMNPIVYAFRIRKFKYAFLNIINKFISCQAEVTERSSVELTLDKIDQE
ncbi:adenosine receptor A3-like [Rhinophrynus dorsalis]